MVANVIAGTDSLIVSSYVAVLRRYWWLACTLVPSGQKRCSVVTAAQLPIIFFVYIVARGGGQIFTCWRHNPFMTDHNLETHQRLPLVVVADRDIERCAEKLAGILCTPYIMDDRVVISWYCPTVQAQGAAPLNPKFF